MGLKSKQLDLDDLAVQLINIIDNNSIYKDNWKSVLEISFLSAVFSNANSNISNGQRTFTVAYSKTITNLFIFKNGLKLIENVNYTYAPGSGNFSVNLNSSAQSSDILEFNYH